MTKYTHQDVLDAALLEIADRANSMVALDGYPATPAYAEVAALTLATTAMSTGVTSGDYTLDDGTPGGSRKVTVAAKSDVSITASGTAINVALLDTVSEKIIHIAECTSLQLVSGQLVNFPAWDITFLQPT